MVQMVDIYYFTLSFKFEFLFLVPTVTIVVEGGPDTLSAIYNDLRTDIPVVLIDVRVIVEIILISY